LLKYDYRVLAKILANRLLAVLGKVVHPAQSAFLQRRHIGDSIRLLQLLPGRLRSCIRSNGWRLLFSLILQKLATRWIDPQVLQGLLYDVATASGIGDGFVGWMRVLLSDTHPCAVVNGFCSPFYKCDAGVRQGCPLAPLLYLFVGQALLCI
jgi:hypothetical protein